MICIRFVGQLGKRTRYQVKNTSQLIVGIARKDNQNTFSPSENIEEKPRILPKVIVELRFSLIRIVKVIFRIYLWTMMLFWMKFNLKMETFIMI